MFPFLIDLALVKVLPVGDKGAVVVEWDLRFIDIIPMNLRPMWRWSLDGGSLDLGLQLPVGSALDEDPSIDSVQLITKYLGHF
jgi:hypothetical protein